MSEKSSGEWSFVENVPRKVHALGGDFRTGENGGQDFGSRTSKCFVALHGLEADGAAVVDAAVVDAEAVDAEGVPVSRHSPEFFEPAYSAFELLDFGVPFVVVAVAAAGIVAFVIVAVVTFDFVASSC